MFDTDLQTKDRLMRLPEVLKMTGVTKGTIYNLMKGGDFPTQGRIGATAVWPESEVVAYVEKIKKARLAKTA